VNNSPDKSLSSEKNLPPKSKTKGLQETPTKHSTSKINQPKKWNDFPSNTSKKCINPKTLIVAKIRRKNFTINPKSSRSTSKLMENEYFVGKNPREDLKKQKKTKKHPE
jgi:hypothetical protein